MLAQIILYYFSLLKIYCIHPWFGISICSALKVPVAEHFISVTLHAKEIKKYIVKAFPRYVSNQLCTWVIWCVGTGEQRITKRSQSFTMPWKSRSGLWVYENICWKFHKPIIILLLWIKNILLWCCLKGLLKGSESFLSWTRSSGVVGLTRQYQGLPLQQRGSPFIL